MKVYEVKMVLASKAVKVGHEVVDRNNLIGFSFVQRRHGQCIALVRMDFNVSSTCTVCIIPWTLHYIPDYHIFDYNIEMKGLTLTNVIIILGFTKDILDDRCNRESTNLIFY